MTECEEVARSLSAVPYFASSEAARAWARGRLPGEPEQVIDNVAAALLRNARISDLWEQMP